MFGEVPPFPHGFSLGPPHSNRGQGGRDARLTGPQGGAHDYNMAWGAVKEQPSLRLRLQVGDLFIGR
jgi:hypothetical protein